MNANQSTSTPGRDVERDEGTVDAVIPSNQRDFTFWQEAWLQVRLVWRLLRDPAVPFYLKLIPAAALLYLFLPVDLLPDALLGLGQVDDLGLLLIGARMFIHLAPAGIVEEHRLELEGQGIPADKEVFDDIIIDPDRKRA